MEKVGSIKELIEDCNMINLNVSISYQRMTGISIEIYTGYKSSYKEFYYQDGYISLDKAIKEAFEFLHQYESQRIGEVVNKNMKNKDIDLSAITYEKMNGLVDFRFVGTHKECVEKVEKDEVVIPSKEWDNQTWFDDSPDLTFSIKEDIQQLSSSVIEKLAELKIKRNHTGRWGVLVGRGSAQYAFMHEHKDEVIEYIRDNFNSLFSC